MLICFALGCAFVLDRIVEPYKFVGSHAEFDPAALMDSTLVITTVIFACWGGLFAIGLRKAKFGAMLLVSLVSAAALVALFYMGEGTSYRATAILANGAGMAFILLVMPMLSILSGLAYSIALRLVKSSPGLREQTDLNQEREGAI